MEDFVLEIKKDLEKVGYNLNRFYNEPGTWYDNLWKDVETWYFDLPEIDIFKRMFTTENPWIPLNPHKPIIRSQYVDYVKDKPIKIQWTLKASKELEFVAVRGNKI